jgi:hypothetical protein
MRAEDQRWCEELAGKIGVTADRVARAHEFFRRDRALTEAHCLAADAEAEICPVLGPVEHPLGIEVFRQRRADFDGFLICYRADGVRLTIHRTHLGGLK